MERQITPEYKIRLVRRLRQQETPSEAVLWKALRQHGLNNWHFRRQHPIDRFIADFFCHALQLVIEIDGAYHFTEEQKSLDEERSAHFTGRGYCILRFTSEEVMTNLPGVLHKITEVGIEQEKHVSP